MFLDKDNKIQCYGKAFTICYYYQWAAKKWLPSSGSLMEVSLWQLIYKGVVITERLTMER